MVAYITEKSLWAGPTLKNKNLKKGLACCLEYLPIPRHFNGRINNRFHARAYCSIVMPIPSHCPTNGRFQAVARDQLQNYISKFPPTTNPISGTRPVRGLAITISLIPGHKLRYLRFPTAVSYDQGSVPVHGDEPCVYSHG
jgi:hypothetical protein